MDNVTRRRRERFNINLVLIDELGGFLPVVLNLAKNARAKAP